MMTINELMDELKSKIESLLDNAKEEGFKLGKEAGVLKSIEALRNLDSTKVEEKSKVKRKYKKKIKVQEKPESVIENEVITESVTKKGIKEEVKKDSVYDELKEIMTKSFSKRKESVISKPKKEYEEPDPTEVEMNLKIIEEEGAKKEEKSKSGKTKKLNKVKEKANELEKKYENRVKECLEEAETISEAIDLFRNKSSNKSMTMARKRFYKFKELIKDSGLGEKCGICGGKITEPMSDGNVCRNCRAESNDFSVEISEKGSYNIRCKECGKGKPKGSFPTGKRVCRACRKLK